MLIGWALPTQERVFGKRTTPPVAGTAKPRKSEVIDFELAGLNDHQLARRIKMAQRFIDKADPVTLGAAKEVMQVLEAELLRRKPR